MAGSDVLIPVGFGSLAVTALEFGAMLLLFLLAVCCCRCLGSLLGLLGFCMPIVSISGFTLKASSRCPSELFQLRPSVEFFGFLGFLVTLTLLIARIGSFRE